ncbi:hypothetical protein BC936DRAFT_150180 [Jimgerdemannia flammicorona]|uniref:Uncharacterized protein n=1 Tax=Jimgerdemannia flammicorona TaxID=994334 RepID=A0A433CZB1_9FUNG|nr:hypothetical protein BC936DRAFT_150180 [Jimgerdemannia flammicorona]
MLQHHLPDAELTSYDDFDAWNVMQLVAQYYTCDMKDATFVVVVDGLQNINNMITALISMIKVLVRDCGGHGKALEILERLFAHRSLKNCIVGELVRKLRDELCQKDSDVIDYTEIEAKAVIEAILVNHLLHIDAVVPGAHKILED